MEAECAAVLSDFFRDLRKNKEKEKPTDVHEA